MAFTTSSQETAGVGPILTAPEPTWGVTFEWLNLIVLLSVSILRNM